ncbi:LytTR family DNA-binding domain-containing protein [Roseinatronobacter monicus]|uniref:LytTr DNA-binding domain-containing protein n=1 Tax=Roseinatronobacter monicus TaxID=393481 RepID=A0A543K8U0_9RHOB|nr:LytTR family DNA-binding domain-containing protein [Roseinatronobacter monicus]TQM91506.1 LytTr DNA-binding domain-containing protein [Roseinatronobacter monicus]
MLTFRLSKYGEKQLGLLLKIYSGATSQGLSWRLSFRAAALQVLIVLNDFVPVIFYGAMLAGATTLGVYASALHGEFEVWIGVVSFTLSVILGAFSAVLLSERFLLPMWVRYGLWLVFFCLANTISYYLISSFFAYEAIWLFITLPALFVIMWGTYYFYKDSLSFLFHKSRAMRHCLRDKIPAQIRAPIVRITAFDKYVSIKTEIGACELRLPLSDAVEQVKTPGVRVHRSHWIAKDYITSLEKSGRSWYLHVCDERIPVAPRQVDTVKRIIRQCELSAMDT